jgi:hypothetical protein
MRDNLEIKRELTHKLDHPIVNVLVQPSMERMAAIPVKVTCRYSGRCCQVRERLAGNPTKKVRPLEGKLGPSCMYSIIPRYTVINWPRNCETFVKLSSYVALAFLKLHI